MTLSDFSTMQLADELEKRLGVKSPRVNVAVAIAEVLGVTIGELVN